MENIKCNVLYFVLNLTWIYLSRCAVLFLVVAAYNPYDPVYLDDLDVAEPVLENSYYNDDLTYPSADKR